jgi:hypothetical protein
MSSGEYGKPKVGKQLMKSHRTISLTTALLAALVAVAPASASANSLLSGYGGPGAGNQAILGSALIGGGGAAGGGGSSGSSGSGSPGSTGSSAGSEAAGGGETASAGSSGQGARGAGAAGDGTAGRAAGGAAGSRSGHGKASGGAARAYPVRPLDDASKAASAGSGTLGFSAADFGYLLLVVAVLGATGVVTRRLARAPTPVGRPAATGKGP